MSAWLCSHAHIDALVQQMIAEKIITMHMADDIGCQLLYENQRSVYTRYPHLEDRPVLNDIDYTFHGIEAPLDLECVLVACRSWKYQTCEVDDADAQPGWLVVDDLEETLRNELGIPDTDDPIARVSEYARNRGWAVDDLLKLIDRSIA